MTKKKKLRYNALSDVFKAIAHPTRLLIVEELSKKKLCVSELTKMIKADTSTVSKHLALMKNSGIIGNDRKGNQVFYNLRVPCVLNFIECVESAIIEEAQEKMKIIKGN